MQGIGIKNEYSEPNEGSSYEIIEKVAEKPKQEASPEVKKDDTVDHSEMIKESYIKPSNEQDKPQKPSIINTKLEPTLAQSATSEMSPSKQNRPSSLKVESQYSDHSNTKKIENERLEALLAQIKVKYTKRKDDFENLKVMSQKDLRLYVKERTAEDLFNEYRTELEVTLPQDDPAMDDLVDFKFQNMVFLNEIQTFLQVFEDWCRENLQHVQPDIQHAGAAS